MNKTMRRAMRVFAAVTAACLVAALGSGCATKVVTAPSSTPLNTVTAAGTGSIFAAPDVARMTFGVDVNSAKAKGALDSAAATAEKIIAALKKRGVAEEDIQTSGVSLYPTQDERNGRVVVTGYQASISVSAKLRDIEKVGDVIEAASNAGANTVSGPSFEISEDSDQRAQAIENAVENAKKNADAMAKATGKTVGDVVSITSSNVSVPGPLMRAEAMYAGAADAAKVPVEAGQLEVTGEVTVMYELK